ncbi:GNAT family N-acetyltransferase [Nocardioides sp. GXQ0305]|uniref:GNAT family N-acetyltransferase n=1 Tax=Nocardioides sp. GXQ0305 TaxID=3423912 RepID=UPI003D7C384D
MRETGDVPARLRPATPADAADVARIWYAGWQDGHLGRVPGELVAVRTRDTFDARAAARVPDTVVAEVDGDVAGFVMTDADEVDQVYVDAARRGSGLAATLLGAAERRVLAQGHPRAWLAVVPGNERARAFYARQGWRDEGSFHHRAPVGDGYVQVPCHRYVKDVSPLIGPEELADRRPEVVVLDVRWRLGGPPGRPEFEAGHVPGAAYVDLDTELADPPGARGRHPLPGTDTFLAAMRRAGVRRGRPVVVYDDWGGRAAARCWWLLRHHGHDAVRVLDGGWTAWQDVVGEVETGPGRPRAAGDLDGSAGAMPVVDAVSATTVPVLVDARAPERFRGETEPVDPVAGRVPGAVNVPATDNLDGSGRFRSAAELREVYAGVGVTDDDEVAAYCGSGVVACHDLLALESIGLQGALYPGSWSEWVADDSRPVETG